jgi:hypothetical protein
MYLMTKLRKILNWRNLVLRLLTSDHWKWSINKREHNVKWGLHYVEVVEWFFALRHLLWDVFCWSYQQFTPYIYWKPIYWWSVCKKVTYFVFSLWNLLCKPFRRPHFEHIFPRTVMSCTGYFTVFHYETIVCIFLPYSAWKCQSQC